MHPRLGTARAPQPRREYDAIVVGSGMTGGWAAKELCERGLDTIVLEAGRAIDPKTDYVEHVRAWEMPYRGYGDRKTLEREQPVQRKCYACDEWASKFFVNDRDNPYTTPNEKPFDWIRGRQVGGKSIMWGRQVYRWSDLDFEANARDGHGVDWPIRYKDIAPWYDYVEKFVGISGQAEGLPQLPDGQFLPPMEMNCIERDMREAVTSKWAGERTVTIGRVAILTQEHNGRAACHYCGPCERGCVTHSYFSSIASTLPAAEHTGRLTLRPHSVVHSVLYDDRRRRAAGVRFIDAQTMEAIDVQARVVFVCAGALETARIMLNSKSTRFPNGIANGSGQLGRNVMDHCFLAGANATFTKHLDKKTYGNRPNGIYVPRFRNVKSKHADFLRGYGCQGGASRSDWGRGSWMPGFGAEFKAQLIRDMGPWSFWMSGFGECLPNPDNVVELDSTVKDKWGIPALRINVAFGPNEEAMTKDMALTCAEMLEAAGASDVRPFNDKSTPGLCIHEMGTARMGRDRKTSVLNSWNQAHEVPNLFVTDGACMASSACQNPSITYMALTARAAAHAVGELKRRAI